MLGAVGVDQPVGFDEYWLPSLNAVRVPDGVEDNAVITHLLGEYDLEIADGLGDLVRNDGTAE